MHHFPKFTPTLFFFIIIITVGTVNIRAILSANFKPAIQYRWLYALHGRDLRIHLYPSTVAFPLLLSPLPWHPPVYSLLPGV